MKEKYLLENGFVQTDSNQWVKIISESEFHVYDKEENGDIFNDTIDLQDYTIKEIEKYVSGYYDNLEEIINSYKDENISWQQIVAEIIAEQSEHEKE